MYTVTTELILQRPALTARPVVVMRVEHSLFREVVDEVILDSFRMPPPALPGFSMLLSVKTQSLRHNRNTTTGDYATGGP